MGFNLNLFFRDLIDILSDKDLPKDELFDALEECILEAKKYAKECNMID